MVKQHSKQKQIQQIACITFGYKNLRPGQQEVIEAVLDGNDTLAVMPTGSGKSAIYQIAALLVPGGTIVISPLIALQRDQLEAIEEQDVAEAAVINSAISTSEKKEAFADLKRKKLKFLFLAPEQFNNEEVLARLADAKPSLFVVDEAHCISEWGHNFRPDYLRLGAVIETLGHPTILALTATASPLVRDEIVERLGMHKPRVFVRGFDRPNICLGVETFNDEKEKQNALFKRIIAAEKPGIVYAATRKGTEEIAELLCKKGIKAVYYHAGMKAADREQVQKAFIAKHPSRSRCDREKDFFPFPFPLFPFPFPLAAYPHFLGAPPSPFPVLFLCICTIAVSKRRKFFGQLPNEVGCCD